MKSKIPGFLNDEKAVSPIISVLLILSIFILFLGIISIEVIPDIVTQEEENQAETIRDCVIDLRNKLNSLRFKYDWAEDSNEINIWSPNIDSKSYGNNIYNFIFPLKYNCVFSDCFIESANYEVNLKVYGIKDSNKIKNGENEENEGNENSYKIHNMKISENVFVFSKETENYPIQVNVLDNFIATAVYQKEGEIITGAPLIFESVNKYKKYEENKEKEEEHEKEEYKNEEYEIKKYENEEIPEINIISYVYDLNPEYISINSGSSAVLNTKLIEKYVFSANRLIIEFPGNLENEIVSFTPTQLYLNNLVKHNDNISNNSNNNNNRNNNNENYKKEINNIKIKRVGKNSYEFFLEDQKSEFFKVYVTIINTEIRF